MTLKIQRSGEHGLVVFTLSGRIQVEHVAELQNLVDFAAAKNRVVLDLIEVRLVDRETVRFLKRCEAEGVALNNCPAYVREWIEKERTQLT
jgi:anti-anti-sigma regulatory factor